MNCDRFSQYIDDLVDGELDPIIKADCEEHIQTCASCKEIYNNYMFMITSLNDFGNLENSDISFPSNLHESIMSAVKNSVSEVTESTTINIVQNNLDSENIVTLKETSSDNIIDITQEIQNKNTDNRSFYKKYGNSLVAGLVSVFVATGAYQTYQHLNSPSVTQTPMITIDAGSDTGTTPYGESSNESTDSIISDQETTKVVTDEIPEIQAEILTEESTKVQSSENLTTDPSTSVSNENVVPATQQPQQNNPQLAQPSMAAVPQTRAVTTSSAPEFKISVNSSDLDSYLEYLSTSPNLSINGVTKTENGIHVSGSSDDFEKFVSFAKDYSEIENPNVTVEYSDETLAKIQETNQLQFTLQQR